jgi:hypothetical protein
MKPMEMTVYNPQKGRLEMIDVNFDTANTTWFDDCPEQEEVYMITDFHGGLLISPQRRHNYPIWIYDITREDIHFDQKKAIKLQNECF